ncbi:helix-turn-helix domain-containing protein [Pukyongiella litopenaei]|uniref:Helix-turn-helix domain-containing protein n=1 Tax=Pukyongiella litopenaei TaxID=2605946 RepID=A0A5C2H8E6_9RHOB|nr:helix-turn-helix domain-containing protein [Pukyongiella litopenaei]QEP30631.1 helix-turn-helix domain-containing protein [Pukyongiella litopenaei]
MSRHKIPPNTALSNPSATPSHLKTVRDVAAEDQVSEKSVRRAIAAGLLDVIRVGPGKRLIRIHPDAHAAYRRAING